MLKRPVAPKFRLFSSSQLEPVESSPDFSLQADTGREVDTQHPQYGQAFEFEVTPCGTGKATRTIESTHQKDRGSSMLKKERATLCEFATYTIGLLQTLNSYPIRRGARRNQISDSRGAALVELAILLPVLLLLVGGIVDYGLGFRARQSLEATTRSAARVGSAAVDQPQFADLATLREIYRGLSTDSDTRDFVNSGRLTSDSSNTFLVAIYDPGIAGVMPSGCSEPAPTPSTSCNKYTLQDIIDSQLFEIGDPNYLTSSLYSKAICATCYWPSSRSSGQLDPITGQAQYSEIGVYIRLDQRRFFSFVGGAQSIKSSSAFILEKGQPNIPLVDTTTTTGPLPPGTTVVGTTAPPGITSFSGPTTSTLPHSPTTYTAPPFTTVPPSIG